MDEQILDAYEIVSYNDEKLIVKDKEFTLESYIAHYKYWWQEDLQSDKAEKSFNILKILINVGLIEDISIKKFVKTASKITEVL